MKVIEIVSLFTDMRGQEVSLYECDCGLTVYEGNAYDVIRSNFACYTVVSIDTVYGIENIIVLNITKVKELKDYIKFIEDKG